MLPNIPTVHDISIGINGLSSSGPCGLNGLSSPGPNGLNEIPPSNRINRVPSREPSGVNRQPSGEPDGLNGQPSSDISSTGHGQCGMLAGGSTVIPSTSQLLSTIGSSSLMPASGQSALLSPSGPSELPSSELTLPNLSTATEQNPVPGKTKQYR